MSILHVVTLCARTEGDLKRPIRRDDMIYFDDTTQIVPKDGPVYIAGAISSDPYYRTKFWRAKCALEARGYRVANPADLPDIFPYDGMIRLSMAMMLECPIVCMLPCWRNSAGAKGEFAEASAQRKWVREYEDMLKEPIIKKQEENTNE